MRGAWTDAKSPLKRWESRAVELAERDAFASVRGAIAMQHASSTTRNKRLRYDMQVIRSAHATCAADAQGTRRRLEVLDSISLRAPADPRSRFPRASLG